MSSPSSLSSNELLLMESIWNSDTSLTSIEMNTLFPDWTAGYIHNLLKSLIQKNMIAISGYRLSGKHNVREYKALYSREEYAVQLLQPLKLQKSSISHIALGLAKELSENSPDEVISELEQVLYELKSSGEEQPS